MSYQWWGWIIVFLLFWIKSLDFPIHDFANYYFAADLLREGQFDNQIYFPEFFNLWIKDSGVSGQFVSYAPNTPFMPLLFVPLTALSVEHAKWVFSLGICILFLISLRRFTHYFEINRWVVTLAPLLFLVPLHHNILFGQMYLWILILLMEGVMAYDKEQWVIMALCWGLAVVLKVFPIVIIGFLVIQKSFRALLYLTISITLFIAVSIWISGWEIWLFYWNEILPRFNHGEIAGVFVDNYQSILMFLKRLFWYDEVHNPYVLIHDKVLFIKLLWVFKFVLISITVWLSIRVPNLLFRFSIWLVCGVAISAYGSTYGLLVLMFLLFAMSQIEMNYRSKVIVMVFLFVGLNSAMIPELSFPWNYIRLFMWMGILGVLVWNYQSLGFMKWMVIGSACIGVTYFWSENPEQNTIEDLNSPILTYDYHITRNGIQYVFWNQKGMCEEEIPIGVEDWSTEGVEILDNQIYYAGKQLTDDDGFKKKAIRVNQSILFLSDQGRGIGFYELRKIDLDGGE